MVFLSYRQENDEHKECVLHFASELKKAGVAVGLDQLFYEANKGGPNEGWPKWSSQQVKDATKVLIIASPGWFHAFNRTGEPDQGLGAACEAHIIFQQLYDSKWVSDKFRVVYMATSGDVVVPDEIKGYHRYNAEKPSDVNDLLEWLGHPRNVIPAHHNTAAWFDTRPDILWPFADALHVRDAFADLLTQSTQHRVLLIRGGSEVGKTCITQHMLGLGLGMPWLACGRLDLKGSTGLDGELENFAQHLVAPGVTPEEVIGVGTVMEKLRRLFIYLQKQARPTLLLLDTYDESQAREFSDWVEKLLLVSTPRSHWLRIVVAGQRVPDDQAASWASRARFIKLEPPNCNDWVACARIHHPDIEVPFIHKLHKLAEGRASLLWNILGPKSS